MATNLKPPTSFAESLNLHARYRHNILLNNSDRDLQQKTGLQQAGISILKESINGMWQIAKQLPVVKRISYTHSMLHAVARTRAVDTEEMVGQLVNSSFPFKRFWIEGPTFLSLKAHNGGRSPTEPIPRVGILVEADQDKHEFKFILIKELLYASLSLANSGKQKPADDPAHITGDKEPSLLFREFTTVSPAGIDLNDDSLLNNLSNFDENMVKGKFAKESGLNFGDSSYFINDLFTAADFLARFFVLISSDKFPNNLQKVVAEQSVDLSKINKAREKKGSLPRIPVSPIVVDISGEHQILLARGKIKEIRQLLGWTSVRRSKPIVSKNGVIFTRKDHDRRIPSAVDRRDTTREVTARQPVELMINESQRPTLIRISNSSEPSGTNKS